MDVGLRGRAQMLVTKESAASSVGSGTLDVFSTPSMIALMEQAAFESIASFLQPDQSSVGTFITAKHLRATPLGATVWAESVLEEVDRRRLRYTIKAYDEKGQIGEAEHERFVVDIQRFMAKAGN